MGVWVMELDGGERRRICDGDQAAWLADGEGILFRREQRIVQRHLRTGQERMVSPADCKACAFPDCSRDGRRVVFVADHRGRRAVFAVRRGKKARQCLAVSDMLASPRWSPDGTRIAYQREAHIHVMNADGSRDYQLTMAGGIQRLPAWSPDGTAIAYCQGADPRGPWHICITSADAAHTTALSRGSALSILSPDWRADAGAPRRPESAPVLRPGPRVTVWDTQRLLSSPPMGWDEQWAREKGWQPIAIGNRAPRRLAGGAAIATARSSLLLAVEDSGPLLIPRSGGKRVEGIELVPLDDRGSEARSIESVSVLKSDGEEALGPLVSRSADGRRATTRWRMRGAGAFVEATALTGAAKLRVRARIPLVVVPDRYGNDLLIDPQARPDANWTLPAERLLLASLGQHGGMLVIVCSGEKQRATLQQPSEGAFPSADIAFDNGSIAIAALGGEGIWYEQRFEPRDTAERLTFGWRMPFGATWRLAVDGGGKRYARMFSEQPSSCYDGTQVSLAKSEAVPPDVDLGLIYLYDRTAQTPSETLTPTDIVRDAVGLRAGEALLDTEGLTAYRTAAARTTWADVGGTIDSIRYLFDRGLAAREHVYVGHLCADVQPFIAGMDERLDEYAAFTDKVAQRCAAARKRRAAGQKLLAAADEMVRELRRVQQGRAGMRPAAEVAAPCAKMKQLVRGESAQDRQEFERLRGEILSIVGPREETLRTCRSLVKALRDSAGAGCLGEPESLELAESIRQLARQVLRNRYYVEDDWRGERYEVPPYWLGPRPFE